MSDQLSTEVSVIPSLPIDVIKARLKDIQLLIKDAMNIDVDYGKIPGCGKKQVLLKPGAEKICLMFRWLPKYEITKSDLPDGHREFEVVCTLVDIRGNFVGQGIGSCSTMETKYKYRDGGAIKTDTPVPSTYWDIRHTEPDRARELLGGKGFKVVQDDDTGLWYIGQVTAKIENPNIADVYNTVLKMAKKRAYLDAVITAAAAGSIFTQDLGDKELDDENDTVAKVDEKTSVLKNKQKQRVVIGKTEDGKYTYKIDKDDHEYRALIKEAGGVWQGKPAWHWLCSKPVEAFEQPAQEAAPNV